MKRYIPFVWFILFTLSCGKGEKDLIRSIDSLASENPDSALTFVMGHSLWDFNREQNRADFALLKSKILYKNYIDVRSDSLTRLAVDYFSSHSVSSKRRDAWYYHGLIQLNMGRYAESIVSLEKAERDARSLNDPYALGLILRSKGNLYNMMLNYSAAIDCQIEAIEFFTLAGKDSHVAYSWYGLGSEYINNKEYDKAREAFLRAKKLSTDPSLLTQCDIRLAALIIEEDGNPHEALALYQSCSPLYYSLIDYGYYAFAQELCGQKDSTDFWIDQAYQHATSPTDTAAIDYMRSRIESTRGNYHKSFILVDNALKVQDANTLSILQESLNTALKEYYHNELELEEEARKTERERFIWISIIVAMSISLGLCIILAWIRHKNRELSEQMARFSAAEKERLLLQRENASLLGNLFSERLHHLDQLSQEYFLSDDKGKKEIVFSTFKKSLELVRNDTTLYDSLENDLDRFCGGIMRKFRSQVPAIQGDNLRILSLFFAGLPYATIQLITRRNSIESLKMVRSRIRKEIKGANAIDAKLFLDMLEIKKTATGNQ